MSRHLFGWSYPPGAANDPNAPYNQVDPPCEVCGNDIDHCLCPECPVCGRVGDPACYVGKADNHGLQHNSEQLQAKAEAEARWAQQAANDE